MHVFISLYYSITKHKAESLTNKKIESHAIVREKSGTFLQGLRREKSEGFLII